MTQESELIQGFMQSYIRTNIQDVEFEESIKDIAKHLGFLMSKTRDLHSIWNTIGFDPVQAQFARNILSEKFLNSGIKIIKKDYFKAGMYLDFFSNFIVDNDAMYSKMLRRTRELEQINSFLDPNLELTIRCCSLDYLTNYRLLANNDRRRNHYRESETSVNGDYSFLRRFDPILESAGELLLDQFSMASIKGQIKKTTSLNQVLALAFIDMNLNFYKETSEESEYLGWESEIFSILNDETDPARYLKTAHESVSFVAAKVSSQPLSSYIATMTPTRY